MTKNVVTVGPKTTVAAVAQVLVEHGISGAPVVDDAGRLLGLVSEGDLLRRAELGTDRHRGRWLTFFTSNAELAAEYAKSHALRVEDVMTTPVVCVAPDASLAEVVDVMEQNLVKRVPVTEHGKLIGIISRGNLVQALGALSGTTASHAVTDRRIRDLVHAEFKRLNWGLTGESNVVVNNGVVHLWGLLGNAEEQKALRVAAESIPGVRRVADHTILIHESDHLRFRSMPII